MTLLFLAFFWNFAKLGGGQDVSSIRIRAELKTDINQFLINRPNKIWFTSSNKIIANTKGTGTAIADDYRVFKKPTIRLNANIVWVPKFFIGSDTIDDDMGIIEWTGIMTSEGAEMIIGYTEAQMMKREGLFKKPGDKLSNFFGLWSVKIVWILAPTNTLLDEVHIMNIRGFNYLQIKDSIKMEETSFDDAEMFYTYDQNNIPLKFKNLINSKKLTYTIDDKEYIAIYLGYDVATEMREEKEFSKIYDIIEEDGKEYIIAWIAKKTYTLLDMMHFVPKGK